MDPQKIPLVVTAAWFTCGQCGLHIEPWDGPEVKRHIVEHYLARPEVIASGEIPEWCKETT